MPGSEILHTISPSNDSTVALEVFKTGLLRNRKHILFFENFQGELYYTPERPESSRVTMCVDTRSLVCRDQWLKPKKQQAVSRYAREEALTAVSHPEIRFSSTRIAAKPLRGFVVEGVLDIRSITRVVKVNVVLNPMKNDRFQIDGDATIRLSDFGVNPPAALLGLIGTKDEALVRLLLWAMPPNTPLHT
jgi:polyisoprenoid-binding protein YceI